MTTTAEPQATTQRPGSWRDEIRAAYELSQAQLRCILADDQPEEFV